MSDLMALLDRLRCVSVAMTSSASKPSTSTCRIRSASSTSCSSGDWPVNSVGVAERPALYSAYSSVRNVCRETSKATPTWVGCLVAQDVDEHRREAVDGVGVLAGARGEVLGRAGRRRRGRPASVRRGGGATHAWQPRAATTATQTPPTEAGVEPMSDAAARPAHPTRSRPASQRAAGDEPRLPDAPDGHRGARGQPRAARRDDAGRGQHPALRPAARRRVGRAGRDPRARSGAALHAGPDRVAVGLDINATHHRAARSGLVTGTATAISLGRTLACYEVVVTDEERPRVCTSRITCLIRDKAPATPA